MRLFVAVDLAPPEALAAIAGRLPAHFHATLRFFGELPEEAVPQVVAAIEGAAHASARFDLELVGIGAFPSAAAPRVVWVGFDRGRDALERLAGRVDTGLAERGIPPDPRGFQPHATVSRVRGRRDRDAAEELLRRGAGVGFGTQTIEEVVLYESRLAASGADHHRVAAARLASPG